MRVTARIPHVALVALALIAGASCQTPPPDPDGLVGSAQPLSLSREIDGSVRCASGGGFSCSPPVRDCQDWYAISIPGEGRVDVTLTPVAGAQGPAARVRLVLADETGTTMRSESSDGSEPARIRNSVLEHGYHVAVIADEPDREAAYKLSVHYSPKPAPPAPRFRALRSAVLELEAEGPGGGIVAVLIESGSSAGVKRGVRGALIDGGERIGEVVVETVYPDGSRARITSLSRSPGPRAVVELQIPIEGGGRP